MSTTVTYKGETLTTVSNASKTLNTSGTWMEGDLTLTDSTTRVATATVSVSTVGVTSISFAVEGEPTKLLFTMSSPQPYTSRNSFYSGVVSGSYDGEVCIINRALIMSTTVSGETTTSIYVSPTEGTYSYENGTVTITTSGYRFPYGTYTVMYAYEP